MNGNIDKEIELQKLKIKELELKKELEEIKEEQGGSELVPFKIPEIIKIPIIIPECPPKPCPQKRVIGPIWRWDPPYVGDIPDPNIVICKTGSESVDYTNKVLI